MNQEQIQKLKTPHVSVGSLTTEEYAFEVWSVNPDSIWLITQYGTRDEAPTISIQELDIDAAKSCIALLKRAIQVCES